MKKNKAWDFLNSSFFITIIAGGLITFLTISYQNKAAKIQRERDLEIRQWEQKKEAFGEYCKKFPISAKSAIDFKYREIWLLSHKNDKDKNNLIFTFDSKNYRETIDAYEKFSEKYAEINSDYLYAIVYSFFDSEEIHRKAYDIKEVMNKLLHSNNKEEVTKSYHDVRIKYEELILLMSEELESFLKKGDRNENKRALIF